MLISVALETFNASVTKHFSIAIDTSISLRPSKVTVSPAVLRYDRHTAYPSYTMIISVVLHSLRSTCAAPSPTHSHRTLSQSPGNWNWEQNGCHGHVAGTTRNSDNQSSYYPTQALDSSGAALVDDTPHRCCIVHAYCVSLISQHTGLKQDYLGRVQNNCI